MIMKGIDLFHVIIKPFSIILSRALTINVHFVLSENCHIFIPIPEMIYSNVDMVLYRIFEAFLI